MSGVAAVRAPARSDMSVLVGSALALDFDEHPPGTGIGSTVSLVRLLSEGFYNFYVDGTLERLEPGRGPHDAGRAHFSKINRVFAIGNTIVATKAGGQQMQEILREKERSACSFTYLRAQVFTGKDRTERLAAFYTLPVVREHGSDQGSTEAC